MIIGKLKVPPPLCKRLILEPDYDFWPGLEAIHDGSFLRGYWQSFRYFEAQATEVRKIFAFVPPLDSIGSRVGAELVGAESVSLHIRRGDYLRGWRNRQRFAVCPAAYYKMLSNTFASAISI